MTRSWGLLPTLCLALGSTALAEQISYELKQKGLAEVRFTIDAPLDSISALTRSVVGSANYDPATGEGNGRIVVDLTAFQTGISLRNSDLREQFFEAIRYPNAVLIVQRLERKGSGGKQAVEDATAIATLSLHGIDRPLRIPVKLQANEQQGRSILFVQGAFPVVLADFHIRRPQVLFLKLGDTAKVEFQATFLGPLAKRGPQVAEKSPQEAVELAPLVLPAFFKKRTSLLAIALPEKYKTVIQRPKIKLAPNSAEARGEKLLTDASLGGQGNAVTCATCHSVIDEREGMVETSGLVRPNRSLFDSAKRATLWQGLAKTAGEAASLCTRLFMLNYNGLTAKQEADLDAYLKAISPDDAVPALDYKVMAMTRSSGLARPTGGDRALGAKLEQRFCQGCHAVGRVRPPLTPGLYEPDYLVQRVRWLPGHDSKQMPPIYVDRLTDSDLRHIVTYLAGDESKRIFDRKRAAAAAAAMSN